MTVNVKICGLKTGEAVRAAISAGAGAVGFMFYPPSPRAVAPHDAAVLALAARPILRVGVFVDPSDELLDATLSNVELDVIQLHGAETPGRVETIRRTFGAAVMKAIKIADAEDLRQIGAYRDVVDWLLFDAKAPRTLAGALPGGNGIAFDWRLLHDHRLDLPWMLSGGLTEQTVAAAARTTRARWVDVSSGVEDRPGHKSVARIKAFMAAVRQPSARPAISEQQR